MQGKSETDWEQVRHYIASGAPIVFDPEDELYDLNDDAAVEAAWMCGEAVVTRVNKSGAAQEAAAGSWHWFAIENGE